MTKTIEYYMSLPYSIVLTPIGAEDGGGWLAEIPLLKGCITDGDSQLEALEMIEDAKRAWLEVALENNEQIPEPEPHIA
ncbi:MAG: type II toxin-antitoxin system HicB family antitoxin [Chloroflexota bacterium]